MFEITENDYTYVENEQSIVQGVKYKSGPYKDVIVMYGTVSIKEDEDLDVARLGFTFQIADPAEFTVEELEQEEAFKNYMGDVLRHIIINNLDNKKARIGNIESEQSTPDTHT